MSDLLDLRIYKLDKEYHGNSLFICREDFIPFSFGGNKARKCYYFLQEILNEEPDYVVSYGSSSSNHCRIVANICAKYNIKCVIISPKEKSKETFNRDFMTLFGAKIIKSPVNEVSKTIDTVINELKSKGKKVYFIPGGGHNDIGTFSYVDFIRRLDEFKKKNKMTVDYIFFPSGTGTTHAGLIIGNSMYGNKSKVIGISIARKSDYGRRVILESISEYLKNNKLNIKIESKECIFIDDHIGGGYGEPVKGVYDIIDDVMKKYGVPMDPTYTGKAFWGMERYVTENLIEGKNILFIHTGGTPLFFDYLGKKREV